MNYYKARHCEVRSNLCTPCKTGYLSRRDCFVPRNDGLVSWVLNYYFLRHFADYQT